MKKSDRVPTTEQGGGRAPKVKQDFKVAQDERKALQHWFDAYSKYRKVGFQAAYSNDVEERIEGFKRTNPKKGKKSYFEGLSILYAGIRNHREKSVDHFVTRVMALKELEQVKERSQKSLELLRFSKGGGGD